jgi:hypothetical protein
VSATEQQQQPLEEDLLREIPPAGEEIHLPGPSIIPFAMAAGITLSIIGLTLDWLWSAIGLIIFFVTLFLWIRDVRHDVDALPEEHLH